MNKQGVGFSLFENLTPFFIPAQLLHCAAPAHLMAVLRDFNTRLAFQLAHEAFDFYFGRFIL